jgi:Tfp pilus assembly protein PilV
MKLKGLTLVEIIVSCIILSLVVAGLAGMFVVGKRYIAHSRSRLSAAQLTRYFLDPLQMNVSASDWGNNCLSKDPTTGCPGPVSPDDITYTPNYTINDTDPDNPDPILKLKLRTVNLTINWTENEPL